MLFNYLWSYINVQLQIEINVLGLNGLLNDPIESLYSVNFILQNLIFN